LVLGVGGLGLRRFGGEFCVGIRVGSAGTEALEFLALGSNGLRGTETLVNTCINEMSSGSLTDTEPKFNTCINKIQRIKKQKARSNRIPVWNSIGPISSGGTLALNRNPTHSLGVD
jgi:hypothetical protein